MSLSHQKDRQIDKKELSPVSDKLLICPECGEQKMQRVRGVCILDDGAIIRDLEREHCFSCGADLFDLPAMKIIREFRESLTHKSRKRASAERV